MGALDPRRRLRILLAQRGMTQGELATELPCHFATLSAVMNGRAPGHDLRAKIASWSRQGAGQPLPASAWPATAGKGWRKGQKGHGKRGSATIVTR